MDIKSLVLVDEQSHEDSCSSSCQELPMATPYQNTCNSPVPQTKAENCSSLSQTEDINVKPQQTEIQGFPPVQWIFYNPSYFLDLTSKNEERERLSSPSSDDEAPYKEIDKFDTKCWKYIVFVNIADEQQIEGTYGDEKKKLQARLTHIKQWLQKERRHVRAKQQILKSYMIKATHQKSKLQLQMRQIEECEEKKKQQMTVRRLLLKNYKDKCARLKSRKIMKTFLDLFNHELMIKYAIRRRMSQWNILEEAKDTLRLSAKESKRLYSDCLQKIKRQVFNGFQWVEKKQKQKKKKKKMNLIFSSDEERDRQQE